MTPHSFGFHTICPSYWKMFLLSFAAQSEYGLSDETLEFWCATMEDLIDMAAPMMPDDRL